MKNGLSKIGVPNEILEFLFKWVDAGEDYSKIPEAKGAISAIRSEAFFIPLYELYLTYGGIFRLTFGPKVCLLLSCLQLDMFDYSEGVPRIAGFCLNISSSCLQSFLIVSDPSIAKHILKDNSKAYSKVKVCLFN